MNNREPCPVCGGEPKHTQFRHKHFCDHGDWHDNGELSGPDHDHDGAKWDAMCRTIRARALADVREKVKHLTWWGYAPHGPMVSRDEVLALFNNKGEANGYTQECPDCGAETEAI